MGKNGIKCVYAIGKLYCWIKSHFGFEKTAGGGVEHARHAVNQFTDFRCVKTNGLRTNFMWTFGGCSSVSRAHSKKEVFQTNFYNKNFSVRLFFVQILFMSLHFIYTQTRTVHTGASQCMRAHLAVSFKSFMGRAKLMDHSHQYRWELKESNGGGFWHSLVRRCLHQDGALHSILLHFIHCLWTRIHAIHFCIAQHKIYLNCL